MKKEKIKTYKLKLKAISVDKVQKKDTLLVYVASQRLGYMTMFRKKERKTMTKLFLGSLSSSTFNITATIHMLTCTHTRRHAHMLPEAPPHQHHLHIHHTHAYTQFLV